MPKTTPTVAETPAEQEPVTISLGPVAQYYRKLAEAAMQIGLDTAINAEAQGAQMAELSRLIAAQNMRIAAFENGKAK